MIRRNILNKTKSTTVLLVHGLFTSAGYWLPYLASLKDYRLIILDIDYRTIIDVDRYVKGIIAIIESEAGGKVDAVISHSLGSLLASQLPWHSRQVSFEVCPVYCATRRNMEEFVEEIERKVKFSMTGNEIRALLAQVDGAIAGIGLHALDPQQRWIYLPDADQYFSYQPDSKFKEFSGDHFDITEAIADIGRGLSS